MVNKNGIITKVNDACVTIMGYKKEIFVGGDFNYFMKKVSYLPYDPLKQAFNGQVNSYEVRVPHATGHHIYLYVTHVPIIVKNEVTGVYFIAQDITEKVEMERALKDSEEKFRLITEHSSDLIKVIDKEGLVSYASPSYRSLLGEHYQNMIGKKLTFGLHEEDRDILESSVKKICGNGVSVRMEYRYLHENATPVWVDVNATSIAGEGDMDHIVLSGRIVSERKQLQEQLTFQAYHDSLTGLPNRRLLEKELETAIEKAEAYTEKLALLFLDCDNFKEINDNYGHDIGDELLVEFSKRLAACIRSEDIVGRMGGDEFVILLNRVEDHEHILTVANRIQASLQQPYLLDNRNIEATSSIGISIYPENGTTTKELFRKADQALYHVKKNGRNDFLLYT